MPYAACRYAVHQILIDADGCRHQMIRWFAASFAIVDFRRQYFDCAVAAPPSRFAAATIERSAGCSFARLYFGVIYRHFAFDNDGFG